jgi:hypothetical protein
MKRVLLVLALLGLFGCESDDDAAPGTAPTISDMKMTPTTIAVGKQESVTIDFAFTDPDGDVSAMNIDVETADGQKLSVTPAVQGVGGAKTGKGKVLLALIAPAAGETTVRIEAVDAAGNTSNALTDKLTAQ